MLLWRAAERVRIAINECGVQPGHTAWLPQSEKEATGRLRIHEDNSREALAQLHILKA